MTTPSIKKKISLEQVVATLFFLGVFFIPFSSFEGVSFLGEYKKEACFFFFITAFLLLGVNFLFTHKIKIPYKNPLFIILVIIITWFFIATLLNAPNIKDYYFKHTSGTKRFVKQYAVLIMSSIILLITYYNITTRYSNQIIFKKIRKTFFLSLIVVSAYGLIEIGIIIFKIGALEPVLKIFNFFPFTEVYLDPWRARISSVTFEPPALATYLLTISGWMFSYILTGKGIKRFIPSILVISLALFSGSRAGLVIILVQVAIFSIALIKKRKHHQLLIKIAGGAMVLVFLIGIVKGPQIAGYLTEKISSFGVNDSKHAISNKSRFGIQYALYQVFLDNPISGVGYGQQAYEMIKNLPPWATANNWEFKHKYLNPDHPPFPPGYNFFIRILAETGIIGFLLFTGWVLFILYTCFSLFNKNNNKSVFALVLFVSMIGFVMNWMKMDTVRVFGFWVNFALLLTLTRDTTFKIAKK